VSSSSVCLKKDLKNEIVLGSFVRKKNLLSSVFCKKCAFFAKFFRWKSAHISGHCKMLATRHFHGTPIVMTRPRLTLDGPIPRKARCEAVSGLPDFRAAGCPVGAAGLPF
jgi:hypothetical protein